MRKLFILLVALIAAPAFALTVTLVDNGGAVDVNYSAAGDVNQPRAFALVVSVSGGATITAVTPTITGESVAPSNLGFGIFPGTIDINDVNGHVNSYGTPVAPATDPGAAGTGIDTNSVVLELGSLYVGGPNAPDVNGTLCTLTIDCNGAIDVIVTAVEEDQYRGGIVLEDSSSAAVTIAPLTICAAVTECLKSTAPEYADWVAYGKPDCWCYERQCRGDIDGISFSNIFPVHFTDLNIFKSAFYKPKTALVGDEICADLDHVAFSNIFPVHFSDLNILKAYFYKPISAVPACPNDNYNFWTTP